MQSLQSRLYKIFSSIKVVKIINLLIFVTTSISFVLIASKPIFENILGVNYPININIVALLMIVICQILFGLKLIGNDKISSGINTILFAIIMLVIASMLGIFSHFL